MTSPLSHDKSPRREFIFNRLRAEAAKWSGTACRSEEQFELKELLIEAAGALERHTLSAIKREMEAEEAAQRPSLAAQSSAMEAVCIIGEKLSTVMDEDDLRACLQAHDMLRAFVRQIVGSYKQVPTDCHDDPLPDDAELTHIAALMQAMLAEDERDAKVGLKGTTDALLRDADRRIEAMEVHLDAIADVIGYPRESWRIAGCDALAHAVKTMQDNYIALREAQLSPRVAPDEQGQRAATYLAGELALEVADLYATAEKLIREAGKKYPDFEEDAFLAQLRAALSHTEPQVDLTENLKQLLGAAIRRLQELGDKSFALPAWASPSTPAPCGLGDPFPMLNTPPSSTAPLIEEYLQRANKTAKATARSQQMERDFLEKKVLNDHANEAMNEARLEKSLFSMWLFDNHAALFAARSATATTGENK